LFRHIARGSEHIKHEGLQLDLGRSIDGGYRRRQHQRHDHHAGLGRHE
jgi:hypothetical protein